MTTVVCRRVPYDAELVYEELGRRGMRCAGAQRSLTRLQLGARAVLGAALKENRALRDLPAVLRGKDGADRPAWLSLVPLCDGGRVVGGVVTLRDR
jgi:hypothetical protein